MRKKGFALLMSLLMIFGATGYQAASTEILEEKPSGLIAHYPLSADYSAVDANGALLEEGYDGTVSNDASLSEDGLTLTSAAANGGGYFTFGQSLVNELVNKDTMTISMWIHMETTKMNTAAFYLGEAAGTSGNASMPGDYVLLNPSNLSGSLKAVMTNADNTASSAPYNSEVGPANTRAVSGMLTEPYVGEMALYTVVITPTQISAYINDIYAGGDGHDRQFSDYGPALTAYLGRSAYNDTTFGGTFKDVRFYDKALTQSEIQALYWDGPGGNPVNPPDPAGVEGGPFLMTYTLPQGTSGVGANAGSTARNSEFLDYSLHLAWSEDGIDWTPLNDNKGILYWRHWGGYNSNNIANIVNAPNGARLPEGSLHYQYPFILRLDDGGYRLLATPVLPTGSAASGYLVAWDSTNLIDWTNQRLITVTGAPGANYKPRADISIEADCIFIYTTDADGTVLYGAISDGMALTDGIELEQIQNEDEFYDPHYESLSNPLDVATENMPIGATVGNVLAITEEELELLTDRFATPAFDTFDLTTPQGVPASLPTTATLRTDDGSKYEYGDSILWTKLPDYSKPGVYEVEGQVAFNYSNPIAKDGGDPMIYKGPDGMYYYTSSAMNYDSEGTGNQQYRGIYLRQASTIDGLSDDNQPGNTYYGKGREIVLRSTSQPRIWAPEIHYMGDYPNGIWVIHFANEGNRGSFNFDNYIYTCTDADPMTGTWNGPTNLVNASSGSMDIDSTMFEADGQWYIVYATTYGYSSHLRIAKVTQSGNAAPTVDTPVAQSTIISYPDYTWANRFNRVDEAPTTMIVGDKIWLAFSSGSTDATYVSAALWAYTDADLTVAESWHKVGYPIMENSPTTSQFGSGHATFAASEMPVRDGYDQTYVFSYHARKNCSYASDNGDSNLNSATRWARICPVYYHKDGTPYFPIPPADGQVTGGITLKGTVEVTASTLPAITEFKVGGYPAAIDYAAGTITLALPYDFGPVTAITPDFTALNGTVSPTGPQDFTNPVVYTVFSPDNGVKEYVVTVTKAYVDPGDIDPAKPYYANTHFNLYELAAGETLAAETYFTNSSADEPFIGMNTLALYDAEGRFAAAVTEEFTVDAGATEQILTDLELPDMDFNGYTVQSFIWDSAFVPVVPATPFTQEEPVTLPDPLLWYEFSDGTVPASGAAAPVVDSTENEYNGVLTNGTQANNPSYGTSNGRTFLHIDSSNDSRSRNTGDWFNAPIDAISGKDEVTFSLNVRTNWGGVNSFQDRFTFAVQQTDGAGTSNKYLALNSIGGNRVIMKNNGSETTVAGSRSFVPNGNVWEHFTISVTPDNITVYKDGEYFGDNVPSSALSALTETGVGIEFGRSSYNADVYACVDYDDFRIYDGALNAEQAKLVFQQVTTGSSDSSRKLPDSLVEDWQALTLSQPSGTMLTSNLSTPPASGENGSLIVWKSSAPAYLFTTGTIMRPSEDAESIPANLIAILTDPETGATITKVFPFTIAPKSDLLEVQLELDNISLDGDYENFVYDAVLKTESEYGCVISWSSSDTSVMLDNGANMVTDEDGHAVTLTVTASKGTASLSKTIDLIVRKPQMYGYVTAYFTAEGEGQQLYLGLSQDGITWTSLAKRKAVPSPAAGSGYVRDPFIIKGPGPDGSLTYYMIATDLNVNGGKNEQHAGGNGYGNKALYTWESDDLITWSEATRIPVADEYEFTLYSNNAWAPEAVWVNDHDNGDGTFGAYMMYFTTNRNGTPTSGSVNNGNVLAYWFTKDFKTFQGEPQYLYSWEGDLDRGGYNGQSMDGSIMSYEEDGTTYYCLFYRRNGGGIYRVGPQTSATSWSGTGTSVASGSYEGPETLQKIGSTGLDDWYLVADGFGLNPARTDLFIPNAGYNIATAAANNFARSTTSNVNSFMQGDVGGRYRHGGFIQIDETRFRALQKEYLGIENPLEH